MCNNDEIILIPDEEGVFSEPFKTIIIPTEEDFNRLQSLLDRDNPQAIQRTGEKTFKCPVCNAETETKYARDITYFCQYCGQRIYAPLAGYEPKRVVCKHRQQEVVIGTQCTGCHWLKECSSK